MTGTVEVRGRLPPRMVWSLRWARYPVVTLKGLRFTERCSTAHVSPHIAKLYQLLLNLIRSKEVLAIRSVGREDHGRKVIDPARSRSNVTIGSRSSRLSDLVRDRIVEMIGEALRDVYA